MSRRSNNNFYVVLDDDETWSCDGYIVLDASLTKEQRDEVHEGASKVFKYEAVPFISIDELIEMLDNAGLWETIVEELTGKAL